MATTLKIDQDGAIRALEAEGVEPEKASPIVRIIHDFLVVPAAETMVTKAAERSARSRFRQKINTALEQVSDLVGRVSRLETDVAEFRAEVRSEIREVKERLFKVETDVAAVKESVKSLKELMLWGFATSTAFLGTIIAIVGLAN